LRALPWNARLKDKLENRLRDVCEGRMPFDSARQRIARDRIATSEKFFGSPARGKLSSKQM
jgi:hypothetical protein